MQMSTLLKEGIMFDHNGMFLRFTSIESSVSSSYMYIQSKEFPHPVTHNIGHGFRHCRQTRVLWW
jgi:hypothetical protein